MMIFVELFHRYPQFDDPKLSRRARVHIYPRKNVTSIIDFGKHFRPSALQFPNDSFCESSSDPTLRQERAFGVETSTSADRNRRVRKRVWERWKKREKERRRKCRRGIEYNREKDREVKRRRSLYVAWNWQAKGVSGSLGSLLGTRALRRAVSTARSIAPLTATPLSG